MPLEYEKHIFCLEGEWDDSLKSRSSILSTLEFLENLSEIKYIFRKVALEHDLSFYLKKAVRSEYKKYSIIYLAFHGKSHSILMADNKTTVSIVELADKFKGKIVHFGSCRTLRTTPENLEYFLKRTGAEMVSGFTTNVDFIDSSIFEIAYFTYLQRYRQVWRIDEELRENYPGLYERLGFRAFSKRDVLVGNVSQ